jgi:hypothetical protein
MPYEKPKQDYKEPKLFESAKYGGICDLCGKEYRVGVPIFAWNGSYFCGSHAKQEIIDGMKAFEPEPEPTLAPVVAPVQQPSTNIPEPAVSLTAVIERMSYEIRSVLRDGHMVDGKTNVLLGHIDQTMAHIDHVLKENSEETRKMNMLLSILVEQGKK